MIEKSPLRVGIAGLGAVGLDVARRLIAGVPGLTLAAVAVRDPEKARRALPQAGDKRNYFPMSLRRVVDEPCTTRSTAAQPHHRGVRAGFVDEH